MERALTVAVVDANSRARRGLASRLGVVAGIDVVAEGGDPEEALRLVGERQPDVVVADVRGLGTDWAGFLTRLGAAAPGSRIVVLTSYLTDRERAELGRAGAGALLLKEIDSAALVRAIRDVAGRAALEDRRTDR